MSYLFAITQINFVMKERLCTLPLPVVLSATSIAFCRGLGVECPMNDLSVMQPLLCSYFKRHTTDT